MIANIEGEKHKVVYIEYSDKGFPDNVITLQFIAEAKTPYWRPTHWDFFLNNDREDDLKAYESGSGGSSDKIPAPQWVDGYLGKYWMDSRMSFEGEPKNGKRLKQPLSLKLPKWSDKKTTKNPFLIAEITFSEEYCERCGCYSVDFCDEHKYCDDEWNERYKDDDSCCN